MQEGRDSGGRLGGEAGRKGRAEGGRESMPKTNLCITLPLWLLLPSKFLQGHGLPAHPRQGAVPDLCLVQVSGPSLHLLLGIDFVPDPSSWLLLPLVFCRDMDRQHIQDREKWKRETAQKIKETKVRGGASRKGNVGV